MKNNALSRGIITALASFCIFEASLSSAQVLKVGDIVLACRPSGNFDPTLAVKGFQGVGTIWDDPARRGIDQSDYVPVTWMWTPNDFGGDSVFSIEIEQKTGTIFATSTALYNWGANVTPKIFEIDAMTGAISTIATEAGAGNRGFGHLALDDTHSQLFAAAMTDGIIYRYSTAGVKLSSFDPLGASVPDSFNLAPLGQRVMGLAYHPGENKLYYSVWHNDSGNLNAGVNNEIRSVELDAAGEFLPATDTSEISLPFRSGQTYSMPVEDMEFNAAGDRLLMGEYGVRTTATSVFTSPHTSRVLEYTGGTGTWALDGGTNKHKPGSNENNARGGVAWAYHSVDGGLLVDDEDFVVYTSDYMRGLNSGAFPGAIYGMQYSPATGATVLDSVLIDGDNDIIGQDKSVYGDVDFFAGIPLSIGDTIWNDIDNSGDLNSESGIDGVVVWLFESGQDPLVDTPLRTDVTAGGGLYLFEGLAAGDYFVYVPGENFVGTGALVGLSSSTGNGVAPDPDDDVDGDDNGDADGAGGVISADVTLSIGDEPDNDGDTDTMTNLSVDFGFYASPGLVAVGSKVFDDTNGNGMLDGAEVGIANVTVELYPSGVDPLTTAASASVVTDASGDYQFDGLAAGSYFVHIPPVEFGSGGDLEDRRSSWNSGTSELDDEAGDENGIDAYDPAVTGISSNDIALAAGMEPSGEASQATYTGILPDSSVNMTVDFGFPPAADLVGVGNLVFSDSDGNGNYDSGAGDTVIPGVTVEIYLAGQDPLVDPPLASDVTDASGYYEFDELAPGEYFVFIPGAEFDTGGDLEGLLSSPFAEAGDALDDDVAGGENGIDDPDPVSNGIASNTFELLPGDEPLSEAGEPGYSGTLPDGNVNLTIDFGFVDPADLVAVGNVVFYDGRASGTHQPTGGVDPYSSDQPVVGLPLELFRDGDDPATDTPLATTTTGADGSYYFDMLAPGDYFIHVGPEHFDGDSTGDRLWGWFPLGGAGGDDDDHATDDNTVRLLVDPGVVGVNSAVFSLEAGAELTGESDAGPAPYSGVLADANVDSTVDLGFAPSDDFIAIGNLVFIDDDGDGAFEPGAGELGIDGVTVELYRSDEEPGVDSPVATTVTASGGGYIFDLLPKYEWSTTRTDYFVHIPADQFQSGGPLEDYVSSPGGSISTSDDDDTDENGIDAVGPIDGISSPVITSGLWDGHEDGYSGVESAVLTGYATNYSVDFGFTEKAGTYAGFQSQFSTELGLDDNDVPGVPGGSQNTANDLAEPADNPDGDIYNNALEYALCGNPGDGGADKGFCAGLSPAGTVDVEFFRKEGGLTDVTYTLQTAPAIGDPPTWSDWTGSAPTVTAVGSGVEKVSYTDLETEIGAQGIVRLKVEITGDATGPHYAQTFGWSTVSSQAECETVSNPYAPKEVFSGTIDDGSTATLDLPTSAGSSDISALMTDPDRPYYIEIISGACEGHRFNVASATADSITLDATSPHNTLDPIPDLTGEQFALRPHTVLDDVATAEDFVDTVTPSNNDDPATAGRVLFFDSINGWSTYFAYNDSGAITPAYWTSADNSGLENVGNATLSGDPDDMLVVIDPCAGFFVHSKAQAVDLLMVGVVREWDFVCPLSVGYNFIGSGYPEDQSPNDRDMSDQYFLGTTDPATADQVEFWMSDGATSGVEAYESHFRVDCGDYMHWTTQENSSLATEDAIEMFEIQRAAFINSRNGNAKSDKATVWTWPLPWDPDAP